MGAELFQADGRTDGQIDIMKLKVVFYNFSKAPKIMHKFVNFHYHIHWKTMGHFVRMAYMKKENIAGKTDGLGDQAVVELTTK